MTNQIKKTGKEVGVLVSFSLFFLSLIITVGFLIDVDSSTPIRGYLDSDIGSLSIQTQEAGILSKWKIKLGDNVKAGQVLGYVTKDRYSTGGKALTETNIAYLDMKIQESTARLTAIKNTQSIDKKNLDTLINSIESQISVLNIISSNKKKEIMLTKNKINRAKKLMEKGYFSQSQFDDIYYESIKVESEHLSIIQQIKSYQSSIIQSKQSFEFRKNTASNETSSLERNIIDIQREKSKHFSDNYFEIIAPIDGTIASLIATEGDYIVPSRSAGIIKRLDDKLIGKIIIPPKGLGQVRIGENVSIQLDAYPYNQYGYIFGTIEQIDSSYVSPKDQTGPISLSEPVYYAKIVLKENSLIRQEQRILRPGMTFEIHIKNRSRSILGWFAFRFFGYQ